MHVGHPISNKPYKQIFLDLSDSYLFLFIYSTKQEDEKYISDLWGG